ncbi:MAG: hypothetical protein J3K34DRAFT_430942 [Monoraphidium minutum]|nr:MAG: hypothetical protein J3K34DRAFT_430942 [Monoraphidium minutum]
MRVGAAGVGHGRVTRRVRVHLRRRVLLCWRRRRRFRRQHARHVCASAAAHSVDRRRGRRPVRPLCWWRMLQPLHAASPQGGRPTALALGRGAARAAAGLQLLDERHALGAAAAWPAAARPALRGLCTPSAVRVQRFAAQMAAVAARSNVGKVGLDRVDFARV